MTQRHYNPTQRILVTGGPGFLGSHLCDRLIAQGHDVLCVDNFFTGTKQNIAHLLDHPRFELTRHDVTFPLYVEVDQIYNLACPASPVHYQHDPVQTTKTSVHGAINMLGLAKRTRARILQASTSEVYGDPEVHPQPEEYWARSIRSASALAMTRASAAPRRCSSPTSSSTSCTSYACWRSDPEKSGRYPDQTITGSCCSVTNCRNPPSGRWHSTATFIYRRWCSQSRSGSVSD